MEPFANFRDLDRARAGPPEARPRGPQSGSDSGSRCMLCLEPLPNDPREVRRDERTQLFPNSWDWVGVFLQAMNNVRTVILHACFGRCVAQIRL